MGGFQYGLIEGFYGRQWSWQERRDMAGFLADHGYASYIYAPKGDRALRGDWQRSFSPDWVASVMEWGDHCRSLGLNWGLGLSPLGLQAGYGDAERRKLRAKLQEISVLGPDVLWILFDDMRGDSPALAANQCAAMADVRELFPGRLAMCPSYYSFDPLLDEVFGQRPAHYLEELGQGLPGEIDVLWTGASILSPQYTRDDCQQVAELLCRKPLIWDNYPVNDGRKTCHFLHLDAFRGRPWQLQQWSSGHMVNPMNQPNLSRLPLATLQALYADADSYEADAARQHSFEQLPEPLGSLLNRDWQQFQHLGLQGIPEPDKQSLLQQYAAIDHPAAREVCQWLRGEYRFDPACLND